MQKSDWISNQKSGGLMLISRIFFLNEFSEYERILESYPHTVEHLKEQEYFWVPGNYMDRVYYIVSGMTQTSIIHDGGEEKIFGYWGEGELYPLMCTQMEFNTERSIQFKALTETIAFSFTTETFRRILAEHPEITYACIDRYCRYSNSLLFSTVTNSYESIVTRICNLLYMYLHYMPNDAQQVNVSQGEIASILGTTRVSVARGLTQLRQEKVVKTAKGKIFVLNMDQVLQYSSKYHK